MSATPSETDMRVTEKQSNGRSVVQKINTQDIAHPRVILLPVFRSFKNVSAHAC